MYRKQETAHSSPKAEHLPHTASNTQSSTKQETSQSKVMPESDMKSQEETSQSKAMPESEVKSQEETSQNQGDSSQSMDLVTNS